MRKNIVQLIIPSIIFCSIITLSNCNPKTETTGGIVQVQKIEYKGWQEALAIKNDKISLVIVPEIGRIMAFGYRDGRNLIWNNGDLLGKKLEYPDGKLKISDWLNYGGDKVWTIDQEDFEEVLDRGWPPDEYFDGKAFDYEILDNGVLIKSPVSKYTGTQLERKISLAPNSTTVNIQQTLRKVAEGANVAGTIWGVTQVVPPERVFMDKNPNSKFEKGFKYIREEPKPTFYNKDGHLWANYIGTGKYKMGSDSKKYIAAQFGDTLFAQTFEYREQAQYPDGGCSAQFYFDADYIEMEVLSPLKNLQIGDSLKFDITWELVQLDGQSLENVIETLEDQY